MTPNTMRRTAVGALALLAVTPGVAEAKNAKLASSGGSSTLEFRAGTLDRLGDFKVRIRSGSPGRRSGAEVKLPIKDGSQDPETGNGQALHDGTLVFVRGKRRITLTRVILNTGRTSTLTVRGPQERITFLALDRKNAKTSRTGFDRSTENISGRLTKRAAALLNKRLKTRAFRQGLRIDVHSKSVYRESTVKNGTFALTLDPALLQRLAQQGISLLAQAPAALQNGVLTIPVNQGTIPLQPQPSIGQIPLPGGLNVQTPDVTLPLTGLTLDGNLLNVTVGGQTLPLAALASAPQVVVDEATRQIDVAGASLVVTPEASAALKQLGIDVPAGTPLGSLGLALLGR